MLILAAATALAFWAWDKLPVDARIPIHWNARGEADGFAGRIGIWHTVFGIAGIAALLAVVGNYLGKTRSNFVFGIRTPWTLSSERSWRRTHRLGGRLFVLYGLVILALGILNTSGKPLSYSLIAGLLVVVPVPLIYSYVVWKNDPERNST